MPRWFRSRGRENRFVKNDKTENILMCKAMIGKGDDVNFYSPVSASTDMEQILEDDKRYGIFKPNNGKYFTYRVLNEDEEITSQQVLKTIQYSFQRIALRTPLKFRRARGYEKPDFRIDFRTVASDPEHQLTDGTLMYHYFPISNPDNKLRGLCVVNKRYFWTSHGKSLDMHEIDPKNYPEPNSGYRGTTHDFDQVYTHEVLHGLGLPHSKVAGNVMSPNYGIMAEWMSDEDILRIQAKYGKRNLSEHKIKRWLNWLWRSSERK